MLPKQRRCIGTWCSLLLYACLLPSGYLNSSMRFRFLNSFNASVPCYLDNSIPNPHVGPLYFCSHVSIVPCTFRITKPWPTSVLIFYSLSVYNFSVPCKRPDLSNLILITLPSPIWYWYAIQIALSLPDMSLLKTIHLAQFLSHTFQFLYI